MRNAVQLITYADRLAEDIDGVNKLVANQLKESIAGVHLLPFFTPHDGADAGFDPTDHTQIDPRLGTWENIKELAKTHDVMVDVIVNHVSAENPAFQDFIQRGNDSKNAEMFLTYGEVFPEGASEQDLATIYRPRPGLPFTNYTVAGEKRLIWTTFTPQQIDINVQSAAGMAYLDAILTTLAAANVSIIRLDAVGYAIKTPGTSSFMTPETFTFIDQFAARAQKLGLDVLVEIHSYFQDQVAVAQQVDWVYDFALPPLLLHALFTGDVAPLTSWFAVRPRNCFTVLDTHDGIGVVDVGPSPSGQPGLLDASQLDTLVETIHENTAGESRLATGTAASNLDLYQVNSTYYSALAGNAAAYLLARAVQFFAPGIPQVYYVGLLGTENDMALLEKTGVGRDINRHYYTSEEVSTAISSEPTRSLLALAKLRNSHPGFAGDFTYSSQDSLVTMRWTTGTDWIELSADFHGKTGTVTWTDNNQQVCQSDLVGLVF